MHGWKWDRTGPFAAEDSPGKPARFVVEQIDDACFRIQDGFGFQYRPVDGSSPIVVTHDSLTSTDFASIPVFLSWFVSRYGRHTPAALVHDQLIGADVSPEERRVADDRFLEMMDQLDVPPVRRMVMWSAVTLATRWSTGWTRRVVVMGWALLAACGIALLVAGALTGRPWWCVVALVAPAPAALLWGSSRRAGLIAGYALPAVALPAAASMLGYGTYWVVEESVRRLMSVPPSNDVKELPQPVAYHER